MQWLLYKTLYHGATAQGESSFVCPEWTFFFKSIRRQRKWERTALKASERGAEERGKRRTGQKAAGCGAGTRRPPEGPGLWVSAGSAWAVCRLPCGEVGSGDAQGVGSHVERRELLSQPPRSLAKPWTVSERDTEAPRFVVDNTVC